jgi:type II secretory pathway pseudopilin PulG
MTILIKDDSKGFSLSRFQVVEYHETSKLRIWDKLVVVTLIGLLVLQVVNGFGAQMNEVVDENKSKQLASVISALDLFYKDSSDFLENRSYPKAGCSNDLNEFDFEYTLKGELTGFKSKTRTHSYIKKNEFPSDPQGNYQATLDSTYACKATLPPDEQKFAGYFDNTQHCKFDINSARNCYLYSSTLIGDGYKLAYWSPYYNKFVVYSKFREEAMKVKLY